MPFITPAVLNSFNRTFMELKYISDKMPSISTEF